MVWVVFIQSTRSFKSKTRGFAEKKSASNPAQGFHLCPKDFGLLTPPRSEPIPLGKPIHFLILFCFPGESY